MKMKILIVGGGSMGKRRVRCLKANGIAVDQLRGVDRRADRRDEFEKLGVWTFQEIDDGLAWGPDLVCCCLPEPMHVATCLAAVEAGAHFFCEVPLSIRDDGLDALAEQVARRQKVGAVGSHLPFHPAVRQAMTWLKDMDLDAPRMILFDYSTYLPGWHPYEAVRDFYEPGQMIGVIDLTLSKLWWLQDGDMPTRVCGRFPSISQVDIGSADAAQVLVDTERGAAMTIHFALVQHNPQNLLRIAGETGTVEIDMIAGGTRRMLPGASEWDSFALPDGFDYEQTYIDEIAHLLKCIRGEAQWHYPLDRAIKAARGYDAMLRSAETGQWEPAP